MAAVNINAAVNLVLERERLLAEARALAPQLQVALLAQGIRLPTNQAIQTIQQQQKIEKRQDNGIVAGIVGGATAALSMELIGSIRELTKQSKILSKVQESVNQAMGLLVDLILLPFIPLITWGIINLYKAILGFNDVWKSDPIKTFLDGFLILVSPLAVFGAVVSGLITTWLKENGLDKLNEIKSSWDTWVNNFKNSEFFKDPFKALTEIWGKTWDALYRYLYTLPIIGDALRLLGAKEPETTKDKLDPNFAPKMKDASGEFASKPLLTENEQQQFTFQLVMQAPVFGVDDLEAKIRAIMSEAQREYRVVTGG